MQMTPCDLLSDDSSDEESSVSGDSVIHVMIPHYLKEKAFSFQSVMSSTIGSPLMSNQSTVRETLSLRSETAAGFHSSRSSTAKNSLVSVNEIYQDDVLLDLEGYSTDGSLPKKRKPWDSGDQLRDRLARTVAEVILAKLVLENVVSVLRVIYSGICISVYIGNFA